MKVISLKEVSKRLIERVNKTIKADGVNGIVNYGENNDYPQLMERIISGSVTTTAAADTYAKFLAGSGFNADINNIVVGKDSRGKEITVRNLLVAAAKSCSRFYGFYLHANVNLRGEVGSVSPRLFKNFRFAKLDDRGYTAKVGYHENWIMDRDHIKKFKKNEIKWYDLWNPEPTAIASQVKKAGSIKKYKGQVYFMFLDNDYIYPLSPIDTVYTDADSEAKIGNYVNNEIANGFSDKTAFLIGEDSDEKQMEDLANDIYNWMGPRGDKSIVLSAPTTADGLIDETKAMKVVNIKSNINFKMFEGIDKNLVNKIRKAFKNLPAILIDYETSQLGTTSGEAIKQAVNFYNQMTKDDREAIGQSIGEVLSKMNISELRDNTDWSIKTLKLYDDGINTDINATAGD